jgi:hypothetical protein
VPFLKEKNTPTDALKVPSRAHFALLIQIRNGIERQTIAGLSSALNQRGIHSIVETHGDESQSSERDERQPVRFVYGIIALVVGGIIKARSVQIIFLLPMLTRSRHMLRALCLVEQPLAPK